VLEAAIHAILSNYDPTHDNHRINLTPAQVLVFNFIADFDPTHQPDRIQAGPLLHQVKYQAHQRLGLSRVYGENPDNLHIARSQRDRVLRGNSVLDALDDELIKKKAEAKPLESQHIMGLGPSHYAALNQIAENSHEEASRYVEQNSRREGRAVGGFGSSAAEGKDGELEHGMEVFQDMPSYNNESKLLGDGYTAAEQNSAVPTNGVDFNTPSFFNDLVPDIFENEHASGPLDFSFDEPDFPKNYTEIRNFGCDFNAPPNNDPTENLAEQDSSAQEFDFIPVRPSPTPSLPRITPGPFTPLPPNLPKVQSQWPLVLRFIQR
jgi:hypothetical protein